jgi:hypothetical protein
MLGVLRNMMNSNNYCFTVYFICNLNKYTAILSADENFHPGMVLSIHNCVIWVHARIYLTKRAMANLTKQFIKILNK